MFTVLIFLFFPLLGNFSCNWGQNLFYRIDPCKKVQVRVQTWHITKSKCKVAKSIARSPDKSQFWGFLKVLPGLFFTNWENPKIRLLLGDFFSKFQKVYFWQLLVNFWKENFTARKFFLLLNQNQDFLFIVFNFF